MQASGLTLTSGMHKITFLAPLQNIARWRLGPIVKHVRCPEGAGKATRRETSRAPWRRRAGLMILWHHDAPSQPTVMHTVEGVQTMRLALLPKQSRRNTFAPFTQPSSHFWISALVPFQQGHIGLREDFALLNLMAESRVTEGVMDCRTIRRMNR